MSKQYQLVIKLEGCHVPVEREIVVPSDIRLDWFHGVIQVVMGWNDSHLHQFETANGDFTAYDPDYDETDAEDERSARLADIVNGDNPGFCYVYDFGDDWRHSVEVKSFDYEKKTSHPIHCLKASGACPPEDVGGVSGYERFCAAINEPKHPDHEEMKEWVYGLCEYPKKQKWPDGASATAINKILHSVEYKVLKPIKPKKKAKAAPAVKGKHIVLEGSSGFLDQSIIDKIMKETPPNKVHEALRKALEAQGVKKPDTSKRGRKKQ